MKLSVVIVSYNVRYYLAQCLDSLYKALEGIEAEVIVCDNHSRDGSVEYLSKLFPAANYIRSSHNMGFARANNVAIRQSRGEYVLLLNPDTIVGENVLHEALTFMDSHEGSGAMGVKMLSADGTVAMESRRGIPSPMTAFYKMCGLCARYPKSRRFGKYYMSYLGWNEPQNIEIVSGAFCMIRRKALDKVGLLDEDFFMYGEDIDLSYRILNGGFTNWYIPSQILHYKGESTQKSSFRYVHVFYKAMLIFFRKHYKHLGVLVSLPVETAICVKAIIELVRMQTRNAFKALGFSTGNRLPEHKFHFFVHETSLASCKRIIAGNGLNASLTVATQQTMPDGHLQTEVANGSGATHVVVYDTSAYSYSKILELLGREPDRQVILGTYNKKMDILLTPKDVFT